MAAYVIWYTNRRGLRYRRVFHYRVLDIGRTHAIPCSGNNIVITPDKPKSAIIMLFDHIARQIIAFFKRIFFVPRIALEK